MSTGVTAALARFAAQTRYEDLPPDVVATTKLCVLNILGAALAGATTRIGRLHLALAKESGGGLAHASLIGDADKVSVPFAAYANASLGFALDYEDTVRYIVHPGYITIAAGLAVGESRRVSGRDLLAAVALGYEVVSRIAVSMQPSTERGRQVWGEQYHPFAAAVTAGRLLGLDPEAMEVAFGIAGTYALVPSVYKYFGPVAETRPMREYKLGWGYMCMSGVLAALSAAKGFRGGRGVLDGEYGFWIQAGSDRCDFARMIEGLGSDWLMRAVEWKIHPSIAWNHPAFHATRLLMREHGVRAADVRAIRITGMMTHTIDDRAPAGAVDAQFSLPYTVAATLLDWPLGASMYSDAALADPELRRLLGATQVLHDESADQAFFDSQEMRFGVALTLADGTVRERRVCFPQDAPPFGRAEVERKFRDLAGSVLDRDRCNRVESMVLGLETLADITALADLLRR